MASLGQRNLPPMVSLELPLTPNGSSWHYYSDESGFLCTRKRDCILRTAPIPTSYVFQLNHWSSERIVHRAQIGNASDDENCGPMEPTYSTVLQVTQHNSGSDHVVFSNQAFFPTTNHHHYKNLSCGVTIASNHW